MKTKRKSGSLRSEMRMRVKEHTEGLSNNTQQNYRKACTSFDVWRKEAGLSNKFVRQNPRTAVEQWRDHLLGKGYAVSTVHTYVAGACCGLRIDMSGITRTGTSADKTKSLGLCLRSQQARLKPENAEIVQFQTMVGGRRSAIQRLIGSDFVRDESGEWCVYFPKDKGGKPQLQRIAPEDVDAVRAYFEAVGPEERLFPEPIDCHLDLHQLRAEHARREYQRYAEICRTPKGREEMRRQLWARYTDPKVGHPGYREAIEKGQTGKAAKLLNQFREETKDGNYYLQRSNRKVAKERGLPVGYDRLALCCVSVFALSHWRNEVTVKHYML